MIALTAAQVVRGEQRRTTLATLLAEGATVVAGGESVGRQVRLYPIGTALALVLRQRPAPGHSQGAHQGCPFPLPSFRRRPAPPLASISTG